MGRGGGSEEIASDCLSDAQRSAQKPSVEVDGTFRAPVSRLCAPWIAYTLDGRANRFHPFVASSGLEVPSLLECC